MPYLSVQHVKIAKIGQFVAIEKNLQNVLYVKIVQMQQNAIFSISHIVQKQY